MWIELHESAHNHPKILKLSRDCHVTRAHALGLVASLWTWTLTMSPDGDLSSFDSEDIEVGAGWEGEPGLFFASACKRGLLDKTESFCVVHDWSEFAGSLKAAQRKQLERIRKRDRQSQDCHATDTQCPREPTGPTGPDQTDRTDNARASVGEGNTPEPELSDDSNPPKGRCGNSPPETGHDRDAPGNNGLLSSESSPPQSPSGRTEAKAVKRKAERAKTAPGHEIDELANLIGQKYQQRTGHHCPIDLTRTGPNDDPAKLAAVIRWARGDAKCANGDDTAWLDHSSRAYDGFLADEYAERAGYPLAMFSKEPSRYLLKGKNGDSEAERERKRKLREAQAELAWRKAEVEAAKNAASLEAIRDIAGKVLAQIGRRQEAKA